MGVVSIGPGSWRPDYSVQYTQQLLYYIHMSPRDMIASTHVHIVLSCMYA